MNDIVKRGFGAARIFLNPDRYGPPKRGFETDMANALQKLEEGTPLSNSDDILGPDPAIKGATCLACIAVGAIFGLVIGLYFGAYW